MDRRKRGIRAMVVKGDKLCLRGIESNEPIVTPLDNVVKVRRKRIVTVAITNFIGPRLQTAGPIKSVPYIRAYVLNGISKKTLQGFF